MGRSARHQHERALGRLMPGVAHLNAHGAFQNVENVVFLMAMGAWPGAVRRQPPLGNGIAIARLLAIGLEQRADAAHRIIPPRIGHQDHRRTGRCSRRIAAVVGHQIQGDAVLQPCLAAGQYETEAAHGVDGLGDARVVIAFEARRGDRDQCGILALWLELPFHRCGPADGDAALVLHVQH